MRFIFDNAELETLYNDENARGPVSVQIDKLFRKVMRMIAAAENENVLRANNGLNFKELNGFPGIFSMRLNSQWRLILTIEKREGGNVLHISEIADYHS